MIYDTGNRPRRSGLRDPRVRTGLALFGVVLFALILGGYMLVPTIRASTGASNRRPANNNGAGTQVRPSPVTAAPNSAPSRVVAPPAEERAKPVPSADDRTADSDVKIKVERARVAVSAGTSALTKKQQATRLPPETRDGADLPSPMPKPAPATPSRRTARRIARRDGADLESAHVPDEHYIAGRRVDQPQNDRPDEAGSESSPRREQPSDESRLEGIWTGKHTEHAASLNIYSVRGNTFRGILSVHIGGSVVRADVAGRLSRDGRIMWQETLVRSGDPDSWDLGRNRGRFEGEDRISGQGVDSRGRSYTWSFER